MSSTEIIDMPVENPDPSASIQHGLGDEIGKTIRGSSVGLPIPTRHGRDVDLQRRGLASIRKALPFSPEPDEARWQDLGEALVQGDPLLDNVVDWMMAEGYRATKAMYDQAANRGIASVRNASAPLRAFFEHVENTPAWVDQSRLDHGARCSALAGRMGNYALRDVVLIGGYRLSAVNKTLLATGALKKNAAKRLMETTKWFLDCMAVGGMEKFSPGYVSTLQVRLIHGLVRRQVQKMDSWDVAADGLPINQLDMHNTYLGHSVVYLIATRLLGVPYKVDEAQAVMDLWRYIGWLMGVDEQRLHKTELEAVVALYQNTLSQPGPDESGHILAGALIDEPLAIRFGHFPGLKGRWARAVHLSITRGFLGKDGMESLGLPNVLPWYPLLTGPARFLSHKLVRLLPGGRSWLIRRGFRQQLDELTSRTGAMLPKQFAPHIQVAATETA
jgi:hypothetical protein